MSDKQLSPARVEGGTALQIAARGSAAIGGWMVTSALKHIEEACIALLLAAMTLLTFYQVVLRYVFNDGIDWGLETTTFLFAWLVLFGMSYGVRVGSHIGINALVMLFAPGPKKIAGIIVTLAGLAYAGFVTYGGLDTFYFYWELEIEADDTPVQLWFVYSILPLGGALLAYRFAQVLWRIIAGDQEGFDLADEAREAIDQLGGDDKPDTAHAHHIDDPDAPHPAAPARA